MNTDTLFNRNRATLKLLFVGMLSLAMLIPLIMVRSIIAERQGMQSHAEQTIASRWGGSQTIGGLVAITKTPVVHTDERMFERHTKQRANVPPELSIAALMFLTRKVDWYNYGNGD